MWDIIAETAQEVSLFGSTLWRINDKSVEKMIAAFLDEPKTA
jgi:hypothetical protein